MLSVEKDYIQGHPWPLLPGRPAAQAVVQESDCWLFTAIFAMTRLSSSRIIRSTIQNEGFNKTCVSVLDISTVVEFSVNACIERLVTFNSVSVASVVVVTSDVLVSNVAFLFMDVFSVFFCFSGFLVVVRLSIVLFSVVFAPNVLLVSLLKVSTCWSSQGR